MLAKASSKLTNRPTESPASCHSDTGFLGFQEPGYLSRYSCGLDGPGSIPGKIFLFSASSKPTLGPTQPLIQWVPGALSAEVEWHWREADR
jgi:hypothetical protein